MKKLLTLILVLCLGIAFVGCGDDDSDEEKESSGKSYETMLDNYFKALEKGDSELQKKNCPPYQMEYLEEQYDDDDEVDEYFEKRAETMTDYLEDDYGDNLKISYEIKEETKLDDDKIKEIEGEIKDRYETEIDISAAYKLKLKTTIKGDKDKDTDTTTLTVSKIDGKWYVTDGGLL